MPAPKKSTSFSKIKGGKEYGAKKDEMKRVAKKAAAKRKGK